METKRVVGVGSTNRVASVEERVVSVDGDGEERARERTSRLLYSMPSTSKTPTQGKPAPVVAASFNRHRSRSSSLSSTNPLSYVVQAHESLFSGLLCHSAGTNASVYAVESL
jgi:hypothetical protein